MHILYERPSDDPVFGTDNQLTFPAGDTWYYKSDPRARAFACLDSWELCSPNGIECWSIDDDIGHLPPDAWFVSYALRRSNVEFSMRRRLGSALVAQESISQFFSLALDDHHWRKEARRLFLTSLARIQYDAFSIGSGEDYAHEVDGDGYKDVTEPEAGNLCGFWKFRSQYTNIDLWAFVWLMTVLPSCFILDLKGTCALWLITCGYFGTSPFAHQDPEQRHGNETVGTDGSPQSGPATPNSHIDANTPSTTRAPILDGGHASDYGAISSTTPVSGGNPTPSEAQHQSDQRQGNQHQSDLHQHRSSQQQHDSEEHQQPVQGDQHVKSMRLLTQQFLVFHWLLAVIIVPIFGLVRAVWCRDWDVLKLRKKDSFWFSLRA